MKATLGFALVLAALGGCAIVPNYGDGYPSDRYYGGLYPRGLSGPCDSVS